MIYRIFIKNKLLRLFPSVITSYINLTFQRKKKYFEIQYH